MRLRKTVALVAAAALLPAVVAAADWPQWGGPDRNGVSKEAGLKQAWPEKGPKLVWTFKGAGPGLAAPAVVGDRVYLPGMDDKDEVLFCLVGGKPQWAAKIAPTFDFKGNQWSKGPNATPCVDGDKVYALGSQGELICAAASDGKVLWRTNLPTNLGGEVNPVGGGVGTKEGEPRMGWGYSCSPLIEGDLLIVTPGGPKGLVAALDKKTGQLRWQSKAAPHQATYASPVLATVGGTKQVVAMTQEGAVGVAAADGDLLWEYKRNTPFADVVCPTPLVEKDQVYLTAAKGGKSTLLDVTKQNGKFAAAPKYSANTLSNITGGVVKVGDHLYGANELRDWKCIDFATGKQAWSSRDLGVGSVVAVEKMLICTDQDNDEVALAEADPKEFKIVSRFKLPEQSKLRKTSTKFWTVPVVSNGLLYLRDQELLFCYEVK